MEALDAGFLPREVGLVEAERAQALLLRDRHVEVLGQEIALLDLGLIGGEIAGLVLGLGPGAHAVERRHLLPFHFRR